MSKKMRAPEGMSMGEFAEASGCDRETIRYYEQIGLLQPAARTKAGYRIFTESDFNRLGFILRCRNIGFNIENIRGLLALVDENSYSCADVQKITKTHLQEVQDKLRDLKAMEKSLKDLIATCERSDTPDCPIIDSLF